MKPDVVHAADLLAKKMRNTVKAVTLPYAKYAMTEKMVPVIVASLTIQKLCCKITKNRPKANPLEISGGFFVKHLKCYNSFYIIGYVNF